MNRLITLSLVVLSTGVHAATLAQREQAIDVSEARIRVATAQIRTMCSKLVPQILSFNKDNGIADQYSAELVTAEKALAAAITTHDTAKTTFQTTFSKLHTDIGSLEAANELFYDRSGVQKVLDTSSAALEEKSDTEDAIVVNIDFLGVAIAAYLKDFRVGLPGGITLEQAFARFDTLVAEYRVVHAEVVRLTTKVAQLTQDLKNYPSAQELRTRIDTLTASVATDRTALIAAEKALTAATATLRADRLVVARLRQLLDVYGDQTVPAICKSLLDK